VFATAYPHIRLKTLGMRPEGAKLLACSGTRGVDVVTTVSHAVILLLKHTPVGEGLQSVCYAHRCDDGEAQSSAKKRPKPQGKGRKTTKMSGNCRKHDEVSIL
jgi:hypothetical protein